MARSRRWRRVPWIAWVWWVGRIVTVGMAGICVWMNARGLGLIACLAGIVLWLLDPAGE